jgi:hypothetical protein
MFKSIETEANQIFIKYMIKTEANHIFIKYMISFCFYELNQENRVIVEA